MTKDTGVIFEPNDVRPGDCLEVWWDDSPNEYVFTTGSYACCETGDSDIIQSLQVLSNRQLEWIEVEQIVSVEPFNVFIAAGYPDERKARNRG